MTKIRIISFGNIKSYALRDLTNYYQKLISKYFSVELISLKDPGERKVNNKDFSKQGVTVILSEKGQGMDTIKFKEMIIPKIEHKPQITFVIGNAYGIDDDLLQQADLNLSLSQMTFNHELTLVILLEQLYRIFNLKAGGKYHK